MGYVVVYWSRIDHVDALIGQTFRIPNGFRGYLTEFQCVCERENRGDNMCTDTRRHTIGVKGYGTGICLPKEWFLSHASHAPGCLHGLNVLQRGYDQ